MGEIVSSAGPATSQEQPVISLEQVSVIRAGRPTLDAVDFTVMSGEQWAVIGPNGAGKSTLLSICATTTPPSRGRSVIFGHEYGTIEVTALRERMGYVTAHHQLDWPMSALDIVLTAFTNTLETPMHRSATQAEKDAALAQLQRCGLSHTADTDWRALSQGELVRALLARAALKQPQLLLLDEPTAGLDISAREQLLDLIADLRVQNAALTSIMVTHHLEELPSSTTHAAIMSAGGILAQGRAAEVITSENVSQAFDFPILVDHAHGRWSARSGR